MESSPLGPSDVITYADLLIERRRLDQARALLAEQLKAKPDNADLLHRLALVDYLKEDADEAFATVNRLLAHAPAHFGGRLLHAALLQDRRQFADAEAVYLALIRDYPEEPELYAAYGRLMLATLNFDKARRLAAEALRLDPEHAAGLFVMGMCDLIAGKTGGHSRHIETLVREHPENIRATTALMLALQDRRDWAGALRLARELLRTRPTDENIVQWVRELKVENHWSMLPLYPMRRWGWGGAVAVWAVGIVSLNALQSVVARPVMGALLVAWFAYVAYSWIWPAQLKRLM
jgi:tetratricopeptide (TPR) repeat protein